MLYTDDAGREFRMRVNAAPLSDDAGDIIGACCVVQDTTQLVVSVRRIAADLRPTMLDDLGLIPAIEWFIGQFSAWHGVRVLRHIGADDIDFNRESATAVFRIVQEAMTNVARHSGATEVRLEIARDGPNCIVSIVDNGCGCSSDKRPARNSFGLLGMRERVAGVGGDLRIQTVPDEGFALFVALPLAVIEGKEGN
jgi:two-component system sensor histidine kinase UhpB